MATEAAPRRLREGQAQKRAAILAAAQTLFVEGGFDRTSMDAVAARAGVSKRTVYDYYGDKRRLLLGIVESAGETALRTLTGLLERHLPGAVELEDPAQLERALSAFARELGTTMLASSDYAAAVMLIAQNEADLPELEDHPIDRAHGDALTTKLADLGARGLLDVEDPGQAAEHLVGLTILRVLNEPASRRSDPARVEQIMTDGVHAFMRAYRRESGVTP